jgi:hypothetical protein
MKIIQRYSDEYTAWLDGDGSGHDGLVEGHETEETLTHLRELYPECEWRAIDCEADETEIAPEMRVAAGQGKDRDTGTVDSVADGMAVVR